MLLGIDHLVIAVRDPDEAVNDLADALSLRPGGGGRHDALGTANRLIWLGDTYLELIGVVDPVRARTSWIGDPAVRALEAGGGLATWAVATDAIDADVARLRARGSDLSEPRAGERTRPDGAVVRWRLAAADRLAPDAPPFLIEHDRAAAEWTEPERLARTADPARLIGLELAVADCATTIERFARTLDLRPAPEQGDAVAVAVPIGLQWIRLMTPRDDGTPIATIHLVIPGRVDSTTDLLGCRWVVAG
jgi:catechol 2,3-dioxygenase-like lactoylglutathione lyase family enzyme